MDAIHADIEQFYTQLDDTLNKKHDISNKNCIEKRIKLKKVLEQSEDLKKEVLKYQKTVTDSRRPHPEPKEPVFNELPPVPWVPKLPVSGGLDNRGKKKKALPNAELKSLCDAAESGALDGVEMWPMPENLFPSQAQLLKLGKAMAGAQNNLFSCVFYVRVYNLSNVLRSAYSLPVGLFLYFL